MAEDNSAILFCLSEKRIHLERAALIFLKMLWQLFFTPYTFPYSNKKQKNETVGFDGHSQRRARWGNIR